MNIQAVARIEIPRPVEKVFDVATDYRRLHEFMTKVGPIPAVLSIKMDKDAVPATGATRSVSMSDRSTIGEEILALDRPTRHHYRWMNPPAMPFGLLIRGGEADWRFTRAGDGTRVEWTYPFTLSTFLVYPLAALVVVIFRKWMTNALERIKSAV